MVSIEEPEKALAPKKRAKKPRKEKELPKTKQTLLDEARRLNSELYSLRYRELLSQYKGSTWSFGYHNDTIAQDGNRIDNIDEVPVEVLRRMVSNGRKRLQDFHTQVNSLIEKNPSEALEGNLEGKTGLEIIRFIFSRKQEQLDETIHNLIQVSGDTKLRLEFNVDVGCGSTEIVYYYRVKGRTDIHGVDNYPGSPKEAEKTVKFLNSFDQVIEQVKNQLSGIKIKEVIK